MSGNGSGPMIDPQEPERDLRLSFVPCALREDHAVALLVAGTSVRQSGIMLGAGDDPKMVTLSEAVDALTDAIARARAKQ